MLGNTLDGVGAAHRIAQAWTRSLDDVSHLVYGDTASTFAARREDTLASVASSARSLEHQLDGDVTALAPRLLDYVRGTAHHAAHGDRVAARSDAAVAQRMLASLEARLLPDHGASVAGKGPRL